MILGGGGLMLGSFRYTSTTKTKREKNECLEIKGENKREYHQD